jgi:hypothetical protein
MRLIAQSALFMLFFGTLLVSAGCVQNRQAENRALPATITPAGPVTTKEELVTFVDSAITYAKANGKEKALEEFSNPNGSFVKGELCIYSYDFSGLTIAHPFNPEKIGVNRINEKDAKGMLFIKDLRDAAQNGSGFVSFYYINPAHNRAVEQKPGYVKKVDNNWWLGSGIYQGPVNPSVSPAPETLRTSSQIRAFVDSAVTFARASGKEAALATFNNRTHFHSLPETLFEGTEAALVFCTCEKRGVVFIDILFDHTAG